jgi:hypothetical protein
MKNFTLRFALLIVILSFQLVGLHAQTCGFSWSVVAGNSGPDETKGVDTDEDGNVIIVGSFSNRMVIESTTITSAGDDDIFIAKFSPSGGLIFLKRAGGTGVDAAEAVDVDVDGNIYVTGKFSGTATFDGDSKSAGSGTNLFVAKYSPAGALTGLFTASSALTGAGSSGYDIVTFINDVTGAKNTYVVGDFARNVGLTALDTMRSGGSSDGFLLKLKSDFTYDWFRTLNGTGTDRFSGVTTDNIGRIFVTGGFVASATFGGRTLSGTPALPDVIFAIVTEDGTVTVVKSFGGIGDEFAHAIETDNTNNVYIVGNYNSETDPSSILPNLDPFEENDVFLVKLNNVGDLIWSRKAGQNSTTDQAFGLDVDANDDVYITGQYTDTIRFTPTVRLVNPNPLPNDLFVAKYNNAGVFQFALSAGGTGTDYGNDLATDDAGNIFVGGRITGGTFGCRTIPAEIIGDAFVAKIQCPITPLSVTATTTNPTCRGRVDATIRANGTGGATPLSYRLGTGLFQASNTFTGLAAGSYTITVRDAAQCTSSVSATITDAGCAVPTGVSSTTTTDTTLNITWTGTASSYHLRWRVRGATTWTLITGISAPPRLLTGLTRGVEYEVSVRSICCPGDSSAFSPSVFIQTTTCNGSNWQWAQRGISTTDPQQGSVITVDPNGNSYILGTIEGTVDFGAGRTITVPAAETTHVYLAKYNPTGAIQWVISGRGNSFDFGEQLSLDSEGNVLFTASYRGTTNFGGTSLTAIGGADLLVAKVNSSGVPVWVRSFGGTRDEFPNGLKVDIRDSLYLTGNFQDTLKFGTNPDLVSGGGQDIFIARLDKNGNPVWSQRFGNTGTDVGQAVGVDNTNHAYLTGRFTGTVTFGAASSLTSAGASGSDIFVAKLASNGTVVWSRRAGSTAGDFVNSIATNPDGVSIISGRVGGAATFGSRSTTGAGGFVARYNSDGTEVWVNSEPNTNGFSVAVGDNGKVFVAGQFTGATTFGGRPVTPAGSSDGFITQLDLSGRFDWVKVFGGNSAFPSADEATGVAVDASSRPYVVGNFAESTSFDAFTFTAARDNIFVGKMGCSTTCNAPTGIFASPQLTFANISWTAVTGARSYVLQFKPKLSSKYSAPIRVSKTDTIIRSLLVDTQYDIRVRAVCTDSSDFFTSTFRTLPCQAPKIISIDNRGTTFRLNWSDIGAPAYESSFRLFPSGTYAANVRTTSAGADLTGLTPGQRYVFRVRSECGAGPVFSNYDTLILTVPACETPTVTAAATADGILVSWSTVAGASGYEIQYKFVGAPFWSGRTILSATSFLYRGIPADRTWLFRVRANCSAARELSGYDTATFAPATCNRPTNFTVCSFNNGNGPFYLRWNRVAGSLGYIVHRLSSNGTSWITTAVSDTVAVFGSDTTRGPITFRVQTQCSSSVVSALTESIVSSACSSSCPTPTNLFVDPLQLASTSAGIEWDPANGAISYEIRINRVGETTFRSIFSRENFALIARLNSGVEYEVQVRTICSGDQWSQFTPKVRFRSLTGTCPVPLTFSVDSLNPTSFVIRWQPVAGAIRYQLAFKKSDDLRYVIAPINETSFRLINLSPGTEYLFAVSAICSDGNPSAFSPIQTQTTPVPPVCDLPVVRTITAITDSAATLTWRSARLAQSYRIYIRTGSAPFTVTTTGRDTTRRLTGLIPNTTYTVRIQTICGANFTSDTTRDTTFRTQPECPAPSNLQIRNIETTGAVVSWTNVLGTQTYLLEYRVADSTIFRTIRVFGTPVILRGLQMEKQYFVRLTAICDTLNGRRSPFLADSFITLTTRCDVPTNIRVTVQRSTVVDLTWNRVLGANRYELQFRRVGGDTNWITRNRTMAADTLTGLRPSTTYEYRIRTRCTNGNTSAYSPTARFITTSPVCEPPLGIEVIVVGNIATVRWERVVGNRGYLITFRRTLEETTWTTRRITDTTATSFRLDSLMPNKAYELRVQTVCVNGNSIASPIQNFITAPLSGCIPPRNYNAVPSATSAVITWSTVTGAVGYQVAYRQVGRADWRTTVVFGVGSVSTTISGLTPNVNYEFQVQTLCADAPSAYTASKFFTTPGVTTEPCPIPTIVSTTVPSNTRITVTWNVLPSPPVEGYTLYWRPARSTTWTQLPINVPTQNNFTITNLDPDTEYEIAIQARCQNFDFSPLSPITRIRTSTTCATPVIVRTIPAARTISYAWSAVSGALRYEVSWRESAFSGGFITTSVIPPSTGFTISGLNPNRSYVLRVRAICPAGPSPYSIATVSTSPARESDGAALADRLWTIYPNPARDEATIAFDLPLADEDKQAVTVRLYDRIGQVVYQRTTLLPAGEQQLPIPLTQYVAGLYLVELEYGSTRVQSKLVIE